MCLIFGLIFVFLLFLDIISKVLVTLIKKPIVIIPDFFKLIYVENKGAAWGIGQDKTVFFTLISIIFILSTIIFLLLYKIKDNTLFYSIASVLAGAVGNCIDRLFNGYVVDFFDFYILGYDFPVFNIADICIVIGALLIALKLVITKDELIVTRRKNNV